MSYQVATLLAIVLGPLLAVIITLWHQERTQKNAAKQGLFRLLMAQRRTFPPTHEWVNGLNLIDVVFADDKAVVALWHKLYETFNTKPLPEERMRHETLDLLQQMAHSLGYKGLKQTDIDKFYIPQVHGDMAARQAAMVNEFALMARNLNALYAASQQAQQSAARGVERPAPQATEGPDPQASASDRP